MKYTSFVFFRSHIGTLYFSIQDRSYSFKIGQLYVSCVFDCIVEITSHVYAMYVLCTCIPIPDNEGRRDQNKFKLYYIDKGRKKGFMVVSWCFAISVKLSSRYFYLSEELERQRLYVNESE